MPEWIVVREFEAFIGTIESEASAPSNPSTEL
jgi:hypothetical protein